MNMSDCIECPVGKQCRQAADWNYDQSLVVRGRWDEQWVGTTSPEDCYVDSTIRHFHYPNLRGCIENCPFQIPHQSFCHVAGDGRLPDRPVRERAFGDMLKQRSHNTAVTQEDQTTALSAIHKELASLSAIERLGLLTHPDQNARTPLMMAAMLGDTLVLDILWKHGANSTVAARDVGGFTALMHALELGRSAAALWLTSTAGATLAPGDVSSLLDRGVNISGIPVAPLQKAAHYLGRGGVTWSHPISTNFTVAPYKWFINQSGPR
jgi:hypothetical protein